MPEPHAIRELHGKYRILAELGQGGTAQVWLAALRGPAEFSKLVVLKSMKPGLRDEPELARMFLNEARLAARLNHPNIVQTNEVFEHEGLPVIVMEYLDGQALSLILKRNREDGALNLGMLLRVLSEALGGLHAAHELTDFDGTPLGVVHRDVSPHNVLVTYDGLVKVLDFGIAKLVGTGEATESGVIKGKLHYMAPEQIVAGAIDRRADVYAMGVILWEILAGRRMWHAQNDAVVMGKILNGELPKLSDEGQRIEPRLADLVSRATAFDPNDRIPTAAEFQLELDAYLASAYPNLRLKDLGATIAKQFSDRRKERRAIIEDQIARIGALTDEEYRLAEPIALPKLEQQRERSSTRTRREVELHRVILPWVVVLLLLGALAYVLLRASAPTEVTVLPRPETSNAVEQGSAPRVESAESLALRDVVRLRVTAFPEQARLTLDDLVLSSNPHLGTYPRAAQTSHRLVASAPGYETVVRDVVLKDDQDLVLTLSRRKNPAGPTAVRPAPSPTTGSAPNAPSSLNADAPTKPSECDPPYFFDERGVKKYKPECL